MHLLRVYLVTVIVLCIACKAPGQSEQASSGGLLIIAPAAFEQALGEYVQHKQQQLSVRIETLEDILKNNNGADDPERLKHFLYNQWKDSSIEYVLLVGDADVFPVRYMVLDRVTEPAFNYAFYPSDLYYADLADADGAFEDWNGCRDSFHGGYYGEVRGEKNKDGPINFDGIDYLPEIGVGRWPVSTPQEVSVVADKSILYEQGVLAGDRKNMRTVAMLAVAGWVDSRPALDRTAGLLGDDWSVEKRYYSDKKRNYETPEPTGEVVVELLNDGVGVVCHAGHGKDLEWHRSFGISDLKDVDNADFLPIVFSAGCHTARFATLPPYEPYVDVEGREHKGSDHGEVFKSPPPPPAVYQKGRHNRPSLGEQMLRRGPDGAVAYIGCNTGSQPCALTLMEGFVDGLDRGRLGDCWKHAIRHYHSKEGLASLKPTESWYPPSIFFQGIKFMVYGDPSLVLPGARSK